MKIILMVLSLLTLVTFARGQGSSRYQTDANSHVAAVEDDDSRWVQNRTGLMNFHFIKTKTEKNVNVKSLYGK